ncbi:SH3 domain-containing protein [Alkalibacterium pelagium]|uniref:D-ala-D-ala dipeptidase n=1 Tax=Alkalibacterium pelagium TaxID=426702 RepID=A0A1H7KBX0_9LACT|nr:SH3 domain-containing protein [Alkalibacterium pelagium]GEN50805.1 hypothetical protein APE02nite_14700 [Alkalibacterium pelagium]SEK84044.1 D-ala-D-ala dipeptidase [Alkalibacterium pelagium]
MNRKETVLKTVIALLSLLIVAGIVFLISRTLSTNDVEEEEQERQGEQVVEDPVDTPPSLPIFYNDVFELPLIGAAGYTSVEEDLYGSPDPGSEVLTVLLPGTPFEIRAEYGEWWMIRTENQEGWIRHQAAFVNMPDIAPSIVYDHANSYSSLFMSSYTEIPDVTGESISNMIDFNDRLNREEFIFPILYSTAQKLFQAQQLAMLNGETLVLYESFRSQENSVLVRESLVELIEENEEVEEGVTEAPWSIGWFIHSGISNHNRGAAVDISLAQVNEVVESVVGDYLFMEVTDYTEYEMHTPMHELSVDSAIFEEPISSMDRDGWRELDIHPDASEHAVRLQEYMVGGGFTPLASEWWHFNDLDILELLGPDASTGDFDISRTINSQPEWQDVQENID